MSSGSKFDILSILCISQLRCSRWQMLTNKQGWHKRTYIKKTGWREYIRGTIKFLSQVAVTCNTNPFPRENTSSLQSTPSIQKGKWTFWTLTSCFSLETRQKIICETKFLFNTILPAARGAERTAKDFDGLCGRCLQNVLYARRRQCSQTCQTFIFNTAVFNLITSAIRLRHCENDCRRQSRSCVIAVCLGQPEDGDDASGSWHRISSACQSLLCAQRLHPCQCVDVCLYARPHTRQGNNLNWYERVFELFKLFLCSHVKDTNFEALPSPLTSHDPIQGFQEQIYTSLVLGVTCFGQQPELFGNS